MSERARILVVEDEADVRELIVLHLKREGHDVVAVDEGETALKKLNAEKFDLAVLDWMLPGISGLEICRSIQGRLPVLMVTARAESVDVVLGIEAGADDYVVKPFDVPVLLARVRGLLRRARRGAGPKGDEPLRIQIDALRLDDGAHEVHCGGERVELTVSEFKLLRALMVNQGRVLSREKLMTMVQGAGIVVTDRSIDTHVFALRKKLGGCADVIETIRGVGYRVRPAT
jgi:two-component system phosphate regulon response regulator PhoB